MGKNLKLNSIMNVMKEKKKAFITGAIVIGLTGVAGTLAILDNTEATVKDGWYTEDVAPQYYKNGDLQKGLLEVDGDWFYFGNDGFMKTGFVKINGKNYYFDNKGKMVKGFIEISGSTYYFDESGVMATGKVEIEGSKYDFGTDGKLILEEGTKVEVTEDDDGNQTVVVKDDEGKEVSKVSVSQGSSGSSSSKPSGSNSSGNTGSSSNGGSSNAGSSNSGSSNNGGSSSGSSSSKPSGGNSSGNTGSSSNGGSSNAGSSNSGSSNNGGSSSSGGTTDQKPDTSHWWDGMTEAQIMDKVTSAMVWKNEITGETYHGVNNLKYGWNRENVMYGGLILTSNKYNVACSAHFDGGPNNMLSRTSYEVWWTLPDGATINGERTLVSTITIQAPASIDQDKWESLYGLN